MSIPHINKLKRAGMIQYNESSCSGIKCLNGWRSSQSQYDKASELN